MLLLGIAMAKWPAMDERGLMTQPLVESLTIAVVGVQYIGSNGCGAKEYVCLTMSATFAEYNQI